RLALTLLSSALIIIGALLSLAVLLADMGRLLPWAVGLGVAGVCLLAILSLTASMPRRRQRSAASEGPREAGTVKWFNTSKGFGFISRDQGEDVFVHFRAIRGDGHRVLMEGQRVEFVCACREKGVQAEDRPPLDCSVSNGLEAGRPPLPPAGRRPDPPAAAPAAPVSVAAFPAPAADDSPPRSTPLWCHPGKPAPFPAHPASQ